MNNSKSNLNKSLSNNLSEVLISATGIGETLIERISNVAFDEKILKNNIASASQ